LSDCYLFYLKTEFKKTLWIKTSVISRMRVWSKQPIRSLNSLFFLVYHAHFLCLAKESAHRPQ
jgi:hypothetical protein